MNFLTCTATNVNRVTVIKTEIVITTRNQIKK